MHICAQTHGRAYIQPHTPTRTYIYTPMYTHVCTYTRTRRKFSNTKSALQHCQTEFHHQSDTNHFYYPIAVQSVSILTPHWLCHLYKPLPYVTHLPLIYHPLATIFYLPTIYQLYIAHLPFIITTDHHLTLILFLSNFQSNHSPSYQYVNMLYNLDNSL